MPEAAGYFFQQLLRLLRLGAGTENLSLVLPPNAAALASTATSTVAQMATTRRCSKPSLRACEDELP